MFICGKSCSMFCKTVSCYGLENVQNPQLSVVKVKLGEGYKKDSLIQTEYEPGNYLNWNKLNIKKPLWYHCQLETSMSLFLLMSQLESKIFISLNIWISVFCLSEYDKLGFLLKLDSKLWVEPWKGSWSVIIYFHWRQN